MSARLRLAVRIMIVVATVGLSCIALLLGQRSTEVQVTVGEPSPQDFIAETPITMIEDTVATESRRAEAAALVDEQYLRNQDIDTLVVENIQSFFEAVRSAAVDPTVELLPTVTTAGIQPPANQNEPDPGGPQNTLGTAAPTTVAPGPGAGVTTTSVSGESSEPVLPSTSVETPVSVPDTAFPEVSRTSGVTGQVLVVTEGDGVFVPAGQGLGDIRLLAYDSTGTQFVDRTLATGRFSFTGMASGPVTVLVETESVPSGLTADHGLLIQERVLAEGQQIQLEPIVLEPEVVPQDIQAANLRAAGYSLSEETILMLVGIATGDVVREIMGEGLWLSSVQQEVVRLATERLDDNGGILSEELLDVQREIRTQTILVPIPDVDPEVWRQLSMVVTEVASEFLAANKTVDVVATEMSRENARQQVDPVLIDYSPGEIVVAQGVEVTDDIMLALTQGRLIGFATPRYLARALAVVLVIALLGLYIYRFQTPVWTSLRHIALFGFLVCLAALAARGAAFFVEGNPVFGFMVPAAAFGLMAAILFDARTALLMAVLVGSMTAIATIDLGYTLFATMSTLAPVPFVSAISARRDLRRAALYIMMISAALATVIALFTHEDIPVYEVAGYALANGAVSWLIGTSLLSVLEILFDITTSLRLLDLTDRNHPALRLLEEKAIGSFNHSLMVGTLADRAARRVGANSLLARAAAYYHDLGKTEHPHLFIENQFGIENPHDRMPPDRSAEVIRRHVLDGVKLARKYRIPGEVAEGIVTHHGDAVMHFFYSKAKEEYGADAVDREDYRHSGRKPVKREMAIVMLADSVEGACRAVFETEKPTPERIKQLVDRVVGEKVADGQLSNSRMTLGDLTKAKEAMVDALVGHYHQRIPYPNFPESE